MKGESLYIKYVISTYLFQSAFDIYKDKKIFGPVYLCVVHCECTHSSSHISAFDNKIVKTFAQRVFMSLYLILL